MSSVRGPGDVGELLAQLGDDRAGLVDRQRGLGDERHPVGIGHLERVDVLLGLDQHDVVGRLAHRALDLLVAGVADQHDRVALGGELLGLDVHLGHQRAGGVDRLEPARPGVGVHAGRHAVGGEHHRLPLRHLGLLLDEDGPALAQLLHHVLVVHDLLAHVDRRAVELEGALHGLDGPVDAGAVAAGGRQQKLVGCVEGITSECRQQLASWSRRPRRGCARRSARGRRRCGGSRGSRSRSGPPTGTPARRKGRWSSRSVPGSPAGNTRPTPPRLAAARSLRPQGRVRELLAREPQALLAHEVEQDHRAGVAVARSGALLPRSPRSSNSASGSPARALLAVEGDEHQRRPQRRGSMRAGELGQDRRARRAVVGAHEARDVLGVVVGARPPRPAGSRPGTSPTTLRSPPGTAWKRPPGSARRMRSASSRDAAEPAGRGPSATWRLTEAYAAARVEAVHLRARHAAAASASCAVLAEPCRPRTHQGAARTTWRTRIRPASASAPL